MGSKVITHPGLERWTAKRKAELVLEVIKGQKTIVNAARVYGPKQSDIQKWIDTFVECVRQGLKSDPKMVESAYEAQVKAIREKIGELVLQTLKVIKE